MQVFKFFMDMNLFTHRIKRHTSQNWCNDITNKCEICNVCIYEHTTERMIRGVQISFSCRKIKIACSKDKIWIHQTNFPSKI